jgi:hypothetical protein
MEELGLLRGVALYPRGGTPGLLPSALRTFRSAMELRMEESITVFTA